MCEKLRILHKKQVLYPSKMFSKDLYINKTNENHNH